MKTILSVQEQIRHMKEKGITFQHVTEAEAADFLANNTYYMKLAAYRANYMKYETGARAGQYRDLDFGYLKELSTLDMHLRYFVLQMCLDIEHAIKVQLIRQITQDENEDGYEAVKDFLKEDENFYILKSISRQKSGEYCKNLIEKYYPYFPAWVFVEVVSFGTLFRFYKNYNRKHGHPMMNNKLINIVRDLRNASAHSNCLMNHISEKLEESKQPHSEVISFIKGMSNISQSARRKNLRYKFSYNIVTLLYVYDAFVPEVAKKNRYAQLQDFMEKRMLRNKDYFVEHAQLCGTYHFLKKVLDNLIK